MLTSRQMNFGEPQSEDCLILDVLVPKNPTSRRLPVVFQIHGGGYTLGNAQFYPGDAMVNASNGGIIYVSIQYRLGVQGFLGGSQIAENGVLNAGLLDQRAALDWVQRNIRAFGGDPARVTIVRSLLPLLSDVNTDAAFSGAALRVVAQSLISSWQATPLTNLPFLPQSLNIPGGSHC